jgi:poly-gamma-glutamate synthesis protein (capsule biosynthesis protein)
MGWSTAKIIKGLDWRLFATLFLVLGSSVALYWYQEDSSAGVPVGIVVPHHDMVASTRAAFFESVAKEIQPETVVLVSPDHFNRASYPIIAADKTWNTSIGNIETNESLIAALGLPIENEPFEREHGVTSLLKDIKTFFPNSQLVPLLISRAATYSEVVTMTEQIYAECPDCLLVSSVDFSHTVDAKVAELHDVLALRGLYARDAELLYKEAEVDSPESLVMLTTWANLHEAKRFNLFSHTNSGVLARTPTGEMTTHIIGAYSKGNAVAPESSVTFMLAGDTMFARGVHEQFVRNPLLLETIGERFFWGADVSILNLEGVFTETVDEMAWSEVPPRLLFALLYLEPLRYLRVTGVSVANNHHNDAGELGAQWSDNFVTNQGIAVIGEHNDAAVSSVIRKENGNAKVMFLSVYTHRPFSNLVEQIKTFSIEGYHVVVFAHWGEEYATTHNKSQQTMAEDWIDAGADVVVGSHPHVVQDVGVYKGKPIIYSLGNFLFDQNQMPETKQGMVLGGMFLEDTDYKLSPTIGNECFGV